MHWYLVLFHTFGIPRPLWAVSIKAASPQFAMIKAKTRYGDVSCAASKLF
jgi:hypothetical protein